MTARKRAPRRRSPREVEDRDRFFASRKQALEEIREHLYALRCRPCMDCGGSYPPCCMDFDHRPGEPKLGEISRVAAMGLWAPVLDELAKCDLVCANCHRIRTERRRLGGWF